MVGVGVSLLLLWLVVNAMVFALYWSHLKRLWRDPVFRHASLVVESDDWGAGPLSQAAALRDIADVLDRHRDVTGRAPSFNLALVLAVPDGPAILAGGSYRRVCLDDRRFAPVLTALMHGISRGVFVTQLHGLEHYWPDALLASDDARVRGWLGQPVPVVTEDLPSHLQSRWVNASVLPSTPLSAEAIAAAVADEVQTYLRVMGVKPTVVVPPTFVWSLEVERAWADHGIKCIVTPGWRYTNRNGCGLPGGDEGPILNGDSAGDITYLVRTDYFEPARGRDARYALQALDRAVAEGRPALLENHRDNFIRDVSTCKHSLRELDTLYREALAKHRDLRFLSTGELGRILQTRDPGWLITAASERLPFFWGRLRHSGRPWKLMSLTGLVGVCALIARLCGVSLAKMPRSSGA